MRIYPIQAGHGGLRPCSRPTADTCTEPGPSRMWCSTSGSWWGPGTAPYPATRFSHHPPFRIDAPRLGRPILRPREVFWSYCSLREKERRIEERGRNTSAALLTNHPNILTLRRGDIDLKLQISTWPTCSEWLCNRQGSILIFVMNEKGEEFHKNNTKINNSYSKQCPPTHTRMIRVCISARLGSSCPEAVTITGQKRVWMLASSRHGSLTTDDQQGPTLQMKSCWLDITANGNHHNDDS